MEETDLSPFRAVGVFALVGAFASACLVYRNRAVAEAGGRDLSGLALVAGGLAVLGIGLLLHNRGVALLFACLSGFVSLLQAVMLFREVVYSPAGTFPIEGIVTNVTIAAVLVLLCVLFYRDRWRLRK